MISGVGGGANFIYVGRSECLRVFINLVYVCIKIILLEFVCGGQRDKTKQVQCPSSTEVLAVDRKQDTWQRKAKS